MCWHSTKSTKKTKQKCSNIIILFICISIFHLLQSGLGEHIPHKPEKNGFTAEKTGTSCYMFSLSCPYWTIDVSQPIIIYKWYKRLCSWYFMYNYVTQKLPQIFENYFQWNRDVHGLNTHQANDFYVPFIRLQIQRFSIKIHGFEVWNSFPTFIKISTSLMNFKKNLCKFLIDRNLLVTVSQFWCYMHIFDITVYVYVFIYVNVSY